jgi:class 3 adenylate cyclase
MGTPASVAVAPDGDRSAPVTVLFTDIVGSTELLGALGEQAMDRCVREHFRLLRTAIAAHGGREIKSMGDGLMVTFSVEADGLACAVDMQAAIARQHLPGDRTMRMRVGLHRGPTIEAEGDHWGTTVVVARRVCDIAQAHEILTTDVLVAAAGTDRALVRDLGPMALKGLAEEVAVCALQWDGAPETRSPASEPLRVELPESLRRGGAFVGREAEIERLDSLWQAAAAGERRVLLLTGEPGIGKTSLVTELGRRVHARGAIVLHGRCDESISAAFQPIVEALRQLVGALSPARLRTQLGGWAPDLARLLPEVGDALIGAAPRSTSDPETDQLLMFQAVSQLLSTTARRTPILLLVEDLHWADAATVELVRHLAAQPPAALAIVATLREGELADDHPLGEHARRPLERLALTGLDEPDLAALLAAEGGRAPDPALARALRAQTGGNPLHAEELTRAWSHAGSVVVRDRQLVLAGGSAAPMPASDMRGIIEQRIGRLPADTRRVLTLGSVLGQRFSLDILEQILAVDEPPDLVAALAVAVGERIVARAGEDYTFAHALIRNATYARVGTTRRARLHRQAAEAIEETAGATSERLPELAYHFARCAHDGRLAKAVEYALRAGRESLDQLAHERGATHFATALELLHRDGVPDGERLRCDATIGLGECRRRAGDSSYRATLLDAARQAERLGDPDRLALAALTNGRDFFSTAGAVDEERVATLRSALACDGTDGLQRALLLAQLAMELTYAGDWHGRLALSDEALAIARHHGDPATLVRVLYQRSVALWGVHGLELRRAAVIEAEQQLAQLADPSLTFHISHQGAHAALAAGDVAGAEHRLQTMHDHAASAGQPTLTWFERVAQHRRAILAGRVRDAQRLAFEARDAGQAAGQPDAELWWAGQMFGLRLVQGRLGEADDGRFPAFMAQCPTLHLLLSAQLGAMQAAHGDVAAAQATLADLMSDDLRDVPLDFSWIATVALAGHVCWQLGDRARAQVVVDVLTPWAAYYVDMGPTWLGSASFYLGLLADTRERPAEAHAHFAAATAMHERCGARGFQAHTSLAWAELAAGGELDADDARDPVRLGGDALRTARELGLAGVERSALRLLSRLGVAPD